MSQFGNDWEVVHFFQQYGNIGVLVIMVGKGEKGIQGFS